MQYAQNQTLAKGTTTIGPGRFERLAYPMSESAPAFLARMNLNEFAAVDIPPITSYFTLHKEYALLDGGLQCACKYVGAVEEADTSTVWISDCMPGDLRYFPAPGEVTFVDQASGIPYNYNSTVQPVVTPNKVIIQPGPNSTDPIRAIWKVRL
jgi:hypothetical protein